jgi:hypothetical protein
MPLQDVWADLQVGSFDGLPIDILSTEDQVDLVRAQYEYPQRDGADFSHMGSGPRRVSARVLFFERRSDEADAERGFDSETHISRFLIFWATATTSKEPREFVHPLFGTFLAWVEQPVARATSGERNVIEVECVFVEDSTLPSVLAGPEFSPYQTSTAQADVFATAFDDSVAELGLPSTSQAVGLGDDVRSTLSEWEEPGRSVRDVNGDLSRLCDRIDDALRDIEYATDLERIPLLRTTSRLQASIRRAAEAFKKSAPQLAEYTVNRDRSLDAILVERYGARQLEKRRAEAMGLNDIEDPGLIPAGTVLTLVLDNPTGVAALRGLRGKVSR